MSRNASHFRTALVVVTALALVAVPASFAGRPGKPGGGGSTSCTQSAPGVAVDNNWSWSGSGSWGKPGQQLTYAISVRNYDIGCSSSSFAVRVSAPAGFSISQPTSTITLKAYSSGYVWAYITSPTTIADGDYPITVSVQRIGGTDATAPATTYYKVYSSDSTTPELFWWNPGDGQTITGRSYGVTVSSKDDHAVQKIELYIDGTYKSTQWCDNVTYICQLYYTWSGGEKGQHTATFRSTDWMNNVGVQTIDFTVG